MSATKRRQADRKQELLDEALKETFPASDTPSLVSPGGGITGAEEAPQPGARRRTASFTSTQRAGGGRRPASDGKSRV